VRRAAIALAALVLAGASAGCGDSDPKPTVPRAQAVPPDPAPARQGPSHIFVIVMENKEYGDVIGSRTSPYVNALASRNASATRFYGEVHPSLPNYLALTAGTTFGVTTNCTNCQQSGENLVDQLEKAGVSWKAYMGGMPHACFKGPFAGEYAKKHNPFMYYRSVAGDPARCAKVVPEEELSADMSVGRLPTFGFLSPGLCDDSHDCPVAAGDRYLSRTIPPILRALGPKGFLVLTWDEGRSDEGCCGGLAKGGHIPTVVAGAPVRHGAQLESSYTHYSVLRTIEDALGLPRLRNAGDPRTVPLHQAFDGGLPKLP
jgi:hypothetical protein